MTEAYLENKTHSAQIKALFIVLLLVVTFVVFWQSTGHEFIVYDDNVYVKENVHVNNGLAYQNMLWAFTTIETSNWHPLTWLSHMLDCQIYGLSPRGHHLTNVLFHIINTLLLWYLLFSATRKYWQSIFVAALFALHPLHVESVAWIAERKDLLSTLFMLGALILYTRYTKSLRLLLYILTLVLYALGLMSKPMLVTLPFVMLLWDFWPLGRLRLRATLKEDTDESIPDQTATSNLLNLILEKLPFFAFSILSSIVTYYAQSHGASVAGTHTVPFTFRLVNALVSYAKYIQNMVWPHHLAVIYPLPPTLTLVQAGISGVILLGISFLAYRQTRNKPFLLTGWLWYLGTLVPVIGLVQVGRQAMADRYTYIPLIGLFIMISWGIPALAGSLRYRRTIVTAMALLVLMGSSVCTWVQLRYWKSDITLFTHAIHAVENNYVAHMNLGLALFQRGETEEAIKHYFDALSIRPNTDDLCYYLGLAFGVEGNLNESVIFFKRAVEINPKFAVAHYNLGVALARQGRLDEGIRHFTRALQIEPALMEARKALETAMRLKSQQSVQR